MHDCGQFVNPTQPISCCPTQFLTSTVVVVKVDAELLNEAAPEAGGH